MPMAQADEFSTPAIDAGQLQSADPVAALRHLGDALAWLVDIASDTAQGGLAQLPTHSVLAILRGMEQRAARVLA